MITDWARAMLRLFVSLVALLINATKKKQAPRPAVKHSGHPVTPPAVPMLHNRYIPVGDTSRAPPALHA
ncbi:hypothetical protein [Actinoplanes sp. NPDC023714]|uniref:hypothetical protein n=1 Tax=Actinoplanes sp. NPDC023714 TaxID=3154322 RepID=UPI0033E9C1BF